MNDQFDPNAQNQGGQVPAGWYPDNSGGQRYWDGKAWTEHTAPAATAVAAAAAPAAKADREWFKKKRFIIPGALVGLMVIGGIAGGGSEDSADPAPVAAAAPKAEADAAPAVEEKTEAPAPAPTTAKPKPKAKVVKVTAAQMLKDYEDNEFAADKKYKGKTIQVTGTVDKVDTELFNSDQYVVQISDGSEYAFFTVNCNDMNEKDLAELEVGEEVTATGKFDDGGDLGVELKKCKLS